MKRIETLSPLQEERNLSDLLAAALVGDYDAKLALERYCATLKYPLDAGITMEKYRLRKKKL